MSRYNAPRNYRTPGPCSASPDELVERHLSVVVHIAREQRASHERRARRSRRSRESRVAGGRAGSIRRTAQRSRLSPSIAFRGAVQDSLRHLDPVSGFPASQRIRSTPSDTSARETAGMYAYGLRGCASLGLSIRRFEKLTSQLRGAGCRIRGTGAQAMAFPVEQLPGGLDDPERTADLAALRAAMDDAFRILPQRAMAVIRWRHFDGRPMKRIVAALCISQGRVSQIHARAMRHLRELEGLRRYGSATDSPEASAGGVRPASSNLGVDDWAWRKGQD